MSNLISREDLLKQLGISERFNNADIPAYVIGIIKGMPEAVVRCSECMWSRIKQTKHCKYMICDLTNIVISEVYPQDFYCAFGERRGT